jgi:hypothetical protein
VNIDGAGQKHLFGGQNTSRRTTITPKMPPEAAEHRQRTLYVSSATIVNNNVDYANRTENNAGVALQLSRLKDHRYRNCRSPRGIANQRGRKIVGVVLDES